MNNKTRYDTTLNQPHHQLFSCIDPTRAYRLGEYGGCIRGIKCIQPRCLRSDNSKFRPLRHVHQSSTPNISSLNPPSLSLIDKDKACSDGTKSRQRQTFHDRLQRAHYTTLHNSLQPTRSQLIATAPTPTSNSQPQTTRTELEREQISKFIRLTNLDHNRGLHATTRPPPSYHHHDQAIPRMKYTSTEPIPSYRP